MQHMKCDFEDVSALMQITQSSGPCQFLTPMQFQSQAIPKQLQRTFLLRMQIWGSSRSFTALAAEAGSSYLY